MDGIWWRFEMNKSIGILYLCTGSYKLFWEDFYNSFEDRFLPNTEKIYYVYCDNFDNTFDKYKNNIRVNFISINAMPWPLITLLRFNYFLMQEEKLKKHDYLMFSNANIFCNQQVTEEEFLPRIDRGEKISFVQHPGYYKKKAFFNYQFERSRKSTAYIPYSCRSPYVIGAMFAGETNAFLHMSHVLKNCIETDLKNNIIARWHDESQMNRYIVGKNDYRLLNPGFCYPVGFDLPVENKIMGVSKQAKFDVNAFKGTTENLTGFVPFIKKVFRKIKSNGFIWYLRDCILAKRIKPL